MNYMWPKLSPRGIIAVCDYGSFPNAIPLTVFLDEFIKKINSDAFVFGLINLLHKKELMHRMCH